MDEKDYINIFEQSSELLVVIDPQFTIVAVSDSFVKTTSTVRENIVGCNIFDVFPDNPHDEKANEKSKVLESFNRVLTHKVPDTLPVVKYDIPKPASAGGGFEMKYWQTTNSPILDANNKVKYIIQRAEDVTENKTLLTQLEFDKKALKLLEDSEKRYNMLLMKSQFAFAILKGKNKVITLANDRVKKIWGKGLDIEGKSLLEIMPELRDTPFPALLDEVYATGIPYHGIDVQSLKDPNGELKDEYFNFVFQPYLEADQTISGIAIIGYEVTAQVLVTKALEAQHEAEQKALKLIADSEKRYNMMLMKSPFGFAIFKGKNMVITLANDSIKTFWGKGNDLEGKPLFEVIPELKDSEFPDLLDKVFTTGTPFYGDELLAPTFRNGKLVDAYYNFVYQPYLEADETISGVTVIAYEVTAAVIVKKALETQQTAEHNALKKIEESNNRYHHMLMQSPFAFAILKGKDMVVTLANDLIKEFWGKGAKVEGKALLAVLPELATQPFPAMLDKVYTTGIPVYANEILASLNHHGEMRDRYFNIVYQPYYEADETISGVITIAHDVTAQVLAKNKLTDAKEDAEHKAKIAEEVVKAKQQFLSNMSHEIRTPMNAIVGFTNVVLKTELSTKQKEYIEAIKVSGDSLIVLINDILDIAKVDAGKMTFEHTPFSLAASIAATLHLFEPKIREKNIALVENYDAAIPEVLIGDPVRLRQILVNLLSNAVKFTNAGEISVSVRILKEEADNITLAFSVTDTGIGIPENKLDYIFGAFQQATNETSGFYGGTGLGLSIVKKFVELQGGSLMVNSEPGRGSTFGFMMNFKKVFEEVSKVEETSQSGNEILSFERNNSIRILVVEDMPLNQLLISIILKDFGFAVDIAGNGKIAIEKLQENEYAVILMDLLMPELNGFDTTEYIRTKMNNPIPIIALTADVTTVDVKKCKAVGMSDYISKPIDEKLLYSKIIRYINRTQ